MYSRNVFLIPKGYKEARVFIHERLHLAAHVFNDPFLCEFYDSNHSLNEERYMYVGAALGNIILFVVATDRENKIRIISARKATSTERNYYYENIKQLQKF